MNVGSLDFWICWSVMSASASFASTSAGPPDRSVCCAGRGLGIAPAAPTSAGGAPGSSFSIGVTGFGVALEGSGGACVFSLMSFSDPSLPPLTMPWTSSLTLPAFPDPLKLSASSRFCGVAASIACLTAAMNALRSKTPGCCLLISSTCAAAAWLEASFPGATAAPCAVAAPTAAG